ncbi:histidine kinase [Dactylosporangium sp. NPDC000555]|uniref:sensor histidine kinase n=1 Tax=Dactylosporangium sp. NPDC000555 TaxID=3154260 RepID=UPI00332A8D5D
MPVLRQRSLVDAAAIVVIVAFWLVPSLNAPDWPRRVIGLAAAVVVAGAMLLRRRFPIASTIVVGVMTLAGAFLGVCQDPMLGAAWCLYTVAVGRGAGGSIVTAVFAGVLAGLALVSATPQDDGRGAGLRLAIGAAALSVAWVLGRSVAHQIAAANAAERARVQSETAREVHDVVGHALGVISAQAGVTLSLPDATEQELRETLADVEAHARRSLEEVQALVRTLRSDEQPAGRPAETRLRSVIATTRAAGVAVDARLDGCDRLDDAAGAAVVRIVQEALSNVVRHAPGAACSVAVRYADGEVAVRVRDRGPGTGGRPGRGFGLQGMRERARSAGCDATWGDHPEGGFEVEARLPAWSVG